MIFRIIKKIFYTLESVINLFYNFVILHSLSVDVKGKVKINGKLFIVNNGRFVLHNRVKINSGFRFNPIGLKTFSSFIVKKNGILEIGDGCGLSNVSIVCAEKICIGRDVYIGGDVKIYDTDFHSLNYNERIKGASGDTDIKTAPVYIKSGAFIGTNSIVLKGVTIGNNSVIGAGSVVAKNIPDNEVWAGNPAKFIRSL